MTTRPQSTPAHGTLALSAVEYLNRKGEYDSFEKDVRGLIRDRDALLAALESGLAGISRAGLLLARSNQAPDAPASSISAELAIREAADAMEAAIAAAREGAK